MSLLNFTYNARIWDLVNMYMYLQLCMRMFCCFYSWNLARVRCCYKFMTQNIADTFISKMYTLTHVIREIWYLTSKFHAVIERNWPFSVIFAVKRRCMLSSVWVKSMWSSLNSSGGRWNSWGAYLNILVNSKWCLL